MGAAWIHCMLKSRRWCICKRSCDNNEGTVMALILVRGKCGWCNFIASLFFCVMAKMMAVRMQVLVWWQQGDGCAADFLWGEMVVVAMSMRGRNFYDGIRGTMTVYLLFVFFIMTCTYFFFSFLFSGNFIFCCKISSLKNHLQHQDIFEDAFASPNLSLAIALLWER